MQLPDILTLDATGHIHLTGHRVGLEDIVCYYRRGDSPEMLHLQFPTISLATIHRVIAHYLDHQDETDRYVDSTLEAAEQSRLSTPQHGPSLDELRTRFAKRYARGA
jgi:uncharacterized protein (DUF433 family)